MTRFFPRGPGRRAGAVPFVLATALALSLAAAGCTPDARDYSWGTVEGSLTPHFEDPLVCACNLELAPNDWRVRFACSPTSERADELGYDLTFETPLPVTAHQRGAAYAELQLDRPGEWPSSGFGFAASELELGSEEFGHPGLDEDQQVSLYRELIIWELDVPAQRVCSDLDVTRCMDLAAGHATELRFVCGIGFR